VSACPERSRRERPPHLVLMDICLAGELNGAETAAQIKARFDIPVVFLTAHTEDALLRQARVTQAYGYLVKPVEKRELRATIEMALCRHKLETRLKENQRWLDTTLRSIADAVIATDEKGCVAFMNPVAEGLTCPRPICCWSRRLACASERRRRCGRARSGSSIL